MINQKINYFIMSNDVYDIRHVIARYIKINISKVCDMTLTELADECNVSKGMVSKFIKELGYTDYSMFRIDCKKFVVESMSDDFIDNKSFQDNLSDSLDSFMKTAKNNNQRINEKKLNYFYEDIQSYKYLYVYGKDDDEVFASYFQMHLDNMNSAEKMGFTVILITDVLKERIIDENSVFLSFSEHIEPSINKIFNNCILYNIRDFFNHDAYLTKLYLFYWIDEFSRQIYVHKL